MGLYSRNCHEIKISTLGCSFSKTSGSPYWLTGVLDEGTPPWQTSVLSHFILNVLFCQKHILPDYRINTKQNDKPTANEHFSVTYYLFSFITQPIHDTIEK